jgi:hypothetical protein
MSSGDFTFITLRNITAYQTNNAYIPNGYLLTMSTNGAAQWSNNANLNMFTASTITCSTIIIEPATYSTRTEYTNTNSNPNAVSSMLINIGGTMWKIPIELA